MFEEIFVCLDGSPLAEKILPLARAISAAKSRLTLLRVVADPAELAAEEAYLRDLARRYGAEQRFVIAAKPAGAIAAELERHPHAIAALTTHGRSAWTEALLGGVALRVVGESKRPVLLFRPLENDREVPKEIKTVAVALDGGEWSEKIIPIAVKAAQWLSARLLLLQALPVRAGRGVSPEHARSDVLESSYLRRKATDIKTVYGIDAEWEVLHGDPGDALCRYLVDLPGVLLAMTTRGRSAVERAVLGSVAGHCVRHAGVPMLLYSPPHHRALDKIGLGAGGSTLP